MQIGKLPRLPLATLPTPLEYAPRLTAALGGPRILIKRDDLTGLALGGNKARKLEFLMADAVRSGADVVVTTGAAQSNHAMMTAVAARKLGLDCVLVLASEAELGEQGNLLLDRLLGVEVRLVQCEDIFKLNAEVDRAVLELRAAGRRPYAVPVGGSTPVGASGYVAGVLELAHQLTTQGELMDYLVAPFGSGGTFAGLLLGAKAFSLGCEVIGISVSQPRAQVVSKVVELARSTAALLGLDVEVRSDEVVAYDEYIGQGYGIPTYEALEAIKLVARAEGLFLDPVYSGKAMAGLIDLVRQGVIHAESTVVFLHTGGTGAIFAYHRQLLEKRP